MSYMLSLVYSDITSLSPHDIKGNNKLVMLLPPSFTFTFTLQVYLTTIDQVEYGVHHRLHIYYNFCGIFYFPWNRHQMEGTTRSSVARSNH